MVGLQRLGVLFGSVVLLGSMVLSSAPVSAITPSAGLSVFAGKPGTSWSSNTAANPGDTVNILISFTNEDTVGRKNLLVTDLLPPGVTYKPGSAYILNPGTNKYVQLPETLATSGVTTGIIRPNETVSIQFEVFIPSADHLNCGRTKFLNRVKATNSANTRSYAAGTYIIVDRGCAPVAPPAPTASTQGHHTTAPTPVSPTPTSTTSISVVAIDASTNTVDNSTTTTTNNYTTTPQVKTAATTATTSNDAKTVDTSNAKSLVNTGPGSLIAVVLLAVVVGTIGSRFVLYRLLGA